MAITFDSSKKLLFTSESVTEGHPDKVCDQISDAILDAIIDQDPHARVACETLVTTGQVIVAGEITTKTYVDIPEIVRRTITEIGYTSSDIGFDAASCGTSHLMHARGVSPKLLLGPRHGGRHLEMLRGGGVPVQVYAHDEALRSNTTRLSGQRGGGARPVQAQHEACSCKVYIIIYFISSGKS